MAKKKKVAKNVKKKMREDYLKFLSTPIEHYDGKIRPPVKHVAKWEIIESSSINGLFIDLENKLENEDVWIWSDQHFNHENVIKYGKRPYKGSEDMNTQLIQNYLNTVKEGDVCIWAGDIFFKSKEAFRNEILPLLDKTYNILVVGNHDFQGQAIKDMGFDEIHLILDFKYNDKRCVISHYPFIIENEIFTNIHGHIHQNESEHPHQINVSVEAINYHPVLLRDLI